MPILRIRTSNTAEYAGRNKNIRRNIFTFKVGRGYARLVVRYELIVVAWYPVQIPQRYGRYWYLVRFSGINIYLESVLT